MRWTPNTMRTGLTILGAVAALAATALWPLGSPAALANGCDLSRGSGTLATDISCNDAFGNVATSVGWGDQTGRNGNISADPMFVNFTEGNYHLRAGSPAINTGTASGAPNKDIDGDNRPQGAGYDMGFDEWTSSTPTAVGLASFMSAPGGVQPWAWLALGGLLAGAVAGPRLRHRAGRKRTFTESQ